MSEMTIEDAFSMLGLPIEATEKEIEKAYKSKSKKYHPDKPGGESTIQSKLNKSREVALAYSKIKTAVVPLNTAQSLQRVEKELEIQRIAANLNEKVNTAKKRSTSTLNAMKTTAWVIGGISGLFALIGNNLLSLFAGDSTIGIILIYILVIFGIAGGYFQIRVNQIQDRIDSFRGALLDKRQCANKLATVLGYKNYGELSKDEILGIAKDSYQKNTMSELSIFFRKNEPLNIEELIDLLLLRSEEHGLIITIDNERVTPSSDTRYKVEYQPSEFKPRHEPKKELEPITKESARAMILSGLIIFAVFGGGSIFLIVKYSAWWGFLTGFSVIVGLGLFGSGTDELRKNR